MRHRLFIAVNLPEKIKKKLNDFQFKWTELPAKWTKKQNLHITLVFLGYIKDPEIPEILRITEEVGKKHNAFLIKLNKICYGPPKKTPRMVWAMGEVSKELGELKKDLEILLSNASLKKEARPYSPHITLSRIRQWQFRQIDEEERPVIDESINLGFEVNSIEIMESQLKRTGAEYSMLQSIVLKK
ncbi:MAG: RNA 2',3'-cyclic phosphodiesterase [Candidatus Nealsonbacteria bacterium]